MVISSPIHGSPDVWLCSTETTRHIVPASIDELAELLKRPDVPAASVSLDKFNNVVDYWPADHTIRVETGITLGELQKITRKHNQWWPTFAHPKTKLATVLAHDWPPLSAGLPPPLARRYPRDTVLGLQILNANGELTHCGGRVMKNVAGYDLTRLYCGSAHTLGLTTQATLRLETKPTHLTGHWHPTQSASEAYDFAQQQLATGHPLWACEITQIDNTWGVLSISDSTNPTLENWPALAAQLTHTANDPDLIAVATVDRTQLSDLVAWLSRHLEALTWHARPAASLVFISAASDSETVNPRELSLLTEKINQLGGWVNHIAQPQLNTHSNSAMAKRHRGLKAQLDPNQMFTHPAMAWAYAYG